MNKPIRRSGGWLQERIELFTKRILHRVMKRTAGNVTEAAKLLGRNRTEIYRTLHRYAIAFKTYDRWRVVETAGDGRDHLDERFYGEVMRKREAKRVARRLNKRAVVRLWKLERDGYELRP